MSCSPEAYMLPVSLSRGALIAILACIFVLLGELVAPCLRVCAGVGGSPHALSHESVNPLSQLLSIGLLPGLLQKVVEPSVEKSTEVENSPFPQGLFGKTHRFISYLL